MSNLFFETGEVEVTINDDPERILKFNPSDLAFVERYENTFKKAEELVKKYNRQQKEAKVIDEKNKDKKMQTQILKESNKDCRDLINTLFDENVANVIFGRIHPLSLTKGGKTILENFLMSLTEYIKKENSALLEDDKEEIEKYKAEYDRYAA